MGIDKYKDKSMNADMNIKLNMNMNIAMKMDNDMEVVMDMMLNMEIYMDMNRNMYKVCEHMYMFLRAGQQILFLNSDIRKSCPQPCGPLREEKMHVLIPHTWCIFYILCTHITCYNIQGIHEFIM